MPAPAPSTAPPIAQTTSALRLTALLIATLLGLAPPTAAAFQMTIRDVPPADGRPYCRDGAAGAPATLRFTTPIDPASEITIAAVGDVLLHSPLQRQGFAHEDGFASLWAPVADLLSAADIAYANLEGPLAENLLSNGSAVAGPVEDYDGRVYTGYPMFNYPPRVAPALRAAGIDVVSTANNHSLDRWADGADLTLAALAAADLPYTGTRPADDADHPWHTVTETDGRRIAWLACTYGTNGLPDRAAQVLHCFDEGRATVLAEIDRLAADPAIDAVILTPHWGWEYRHDPNDRQQALARDAIEAGALAVIGAHPHVVQPWERVVTRQGREGFVLYSLGNFVSNQRDLAKRSTLMLVLGLAEDPTGALAVAGAAWVPLHVDFRVGSPDIRVEAIERSAGRGLDAHAHLTGLLPVANIHPPVARLTSLQCADLSADGPLARLHHGMVEVPRPPERPAVGPGA